MQKWKHPLTCLPLLLAIAGCASAPPFVRAPQEVVEQSESIMSQPAIGEASTAATGDNLYNEHPVTSKRTVTVTLEQPAQSTMELGHSIDLPAGKQGVLAKTAGGHPAVCFFRITKPGVGGTAAACLVDTDRDGALDSSMFLNRARYFPLSSPAKYSTAKSESKVISGEPTLKREILYQGVSKGTVRLSFREFMNDMARPAFTQDILYDLEPDGTATVVFKGLRMKILKATGTSIKYVVEKPFAS
ncbi:hypothetical protein [Massilia sp. METH4]|uniref:hypothetical protein n=1 Tax=Massilia sp. METH4 TaxID=3123041 RepID=UPI0030CC1152